MSKKTKKDATDDGPDTPARVDLSLVTSLSLLAGGLASYPSLQGMIEGKVDAFHAAIWFLGATIIAMIGFSIVASLFHSFSAAHHAAEREKARVEAEEAAGAADAEARASSIAAAMNEADAVVHAERAVIS